MSNLISKNLLLISVFVTGACVLIIEIVAVRVLSPYYGSTIFTVSSVISVILLALSVGYYVGGEMADRYPQQKYFFAIILVAGLCVLFFHFIGKVLLPILGTFLSIVTGPLITSVLLFLLPAFLLGTLSPFAIRLATANASTSEVGTLSGKIFFWSTLGSIFGSLLAGFYLIPNLGIDRIFISVGVILCLLGLGALMALRYVKRYLVLALVLLVAILLLLVLNRFGEDVGVVYERDGVYERIAVVDRVFDGRNVRSLRLDRSSSGAMYLDTSDAREMPHDYANYYSIYKVFVPDARDVLVIGGGAYSIPRAYLADLPQATIDVSEIEPYLYDVAKQYFRLEDNQRLHNYTEDGRRFLADSDKKYDVIFSDAYHSLYSIPVHFTTLEFFELAKSRLNADGILIANVIADLSVRDTSMVFSEMRTFRSAFPNSYFFAVDDPEGTNVQNIIFIGWNSVKKIDFASNKIKNDRNKVISGLHKKQINLSKIDFENHTLFTDDYAPVEYLVGQVLVQAVNE